MDNFCLDFGVEDFDNSPQFSKQEVLVKVSNFLERSFRFSSVFVPENHQLKTGDLVSSYMNIWQIKLWRASISASIKWSYLISFTNLIDLKSKLNEHYYCYSICYWLQVRSFFYLIYQLVQEKLVWCQLILLLELCRACILYHFCFRIFHFKEWNECMCILKKNP